MNVEIRRPFVWITVALVGGAGFASAFGPPLRPLLFLFLSSWMLAALLIPLKMRKAATVLALTASFSLGVCTYILDAYVSEIPDQLALHHSSDAAVGVTLYGTVTEIRPMTDGDRLTFTLNVDQIEREDAALPVSGKAIVNWYQPSGSIEPTDRVQVSGKLRRLRGFKNPGAFDYERYMYRQGLFSRVYAKDAEAVIVLGRGNAIWAARIRGAIRQKGLRIISASTLTEETRAFMSAILFGERGMLPDEMKEWFKQTGTFHILAISGLHVGLVYLIVSLALTPLPIGTKSRVAMSILGVWLYALIAGGGVPVTRASIMLTLVLSGYYLSREGDFLTAVALAALLIVGLKPVVVDYSGFQLSFLAVMLLCTFEPSYSNRFYPMLQRNLGRIPAPILSRLSITVFASLIIGIGMIPLVAYHFNIVSFVFPIANLIVIPVLSLALASGFACVLTGFIWLKPALVFGLITEASAWIIFGTVKFCSMIPASSACIVSPPIWILALEALAIALIWGRARWRYKAAVFACAATLAITFSCAGQSLRGENLRLTFLDVGDSDSCFIEFPGGETMLVDTAFATPYLDCGESLIAPFLWKKGISKIDALVLTHPDSDHTGGALFIAENFEIGRLFIADLDETPPEFLEIIEAARARGCTIQHIATGDIITGFDLARIEALNPRAGASREDLSDNDTSLALRIRYGEISMMLTGDTEKKALRLMVDSYQGRLRSHVLKAPHHGLSSGYNKRFVDMARPELVIISGRPHRINQSIEERIARYSPSCDRALSTTECGAIIVETDGHEIETYVTRKPRGSLF